MIHGGLQLGFFTLKRLFHEDGTLGTFGSYSVRAEERFFFKLRLVHNSRELPDFNLQLLDFNLYSY